MSSQRRKLRRAQGIAPPPDLPALRRFAAEHPGRVVDLFFPHDPADAAGNAAYLEQLRSEVPGAVHVMGGKVG